MTLELEIAEQPQRAEKTKLAVIDTDIHNFDVYEDPLFNEIITNYLAPDWQEYHKMIGMRGHYGGGYPRAPAQRCPHRCLAAQRTPARN